jgi:hypothetical protein
MLHDRIMRRTHVMRTHMPHTPTTNNTQVYYFTNFSVKPANKQYASVRNDYELHLDGRCVCDV